jgi:hypothetical protein
MKKLLAIRHPAIRITSGVRGAAVRMGSLLPNHAQHRDTGDLRARREIAVSSSRATGKPRLTGCLPVRIGRGRRRVIDELPTNHPEHETLQIRLNERISLLATTDAVNLRMPASVQLGGICSCYPFWRHFHCLREQECPEDTDDASRFRSGGICHRESPRQLQPLHSGDL